MTATLAPPEPDTTLDYPDTLLIGDHPDTEALDDGERVSDGLCVGTDPA